MSAASRIPSLWRVPGGLDAVGCRRYRIEGGDIAQRWRRDGRDPWCEFTIWNGGDRLGSYGGEVWPTAWPELFEAIPGSAQMGTGGVLLTAAGRAAVAAADAMADAGGDTEKALRAIEGERQ